MTESIPRNEVDPSLIVTGRRRRNATILSEDFVDGSQLDEKSNAEQRKNRKAKKKDDDEYDIGIEDEDSEDEDDSSDGIPSAKQQLKTKTKSQTKNDKQTKAAKPQIEPKSDPKNKIKPQPKSKPPDTQGKIENATNPKWLEDFNKNKAANTVAMVRLQIQFMNKDTNADLRTKSLPKLLSIRDATLRQGFEKQLRVWAEKFADIEKLEKKHKINRPTRIKNKSPESLQQIEDYLKQKIQVIAKDRATVVGKGKTQQSTQRTNKTKQRKKTQPSDTMSHREKLASTMNAIASAADENPFLAEAKKSMKEHGADLYQSTVQRLMLALRDPPRRIDGPDGAAKAFVYGRGESEIRVTDPKQVLKIEKEMYNLYGQYSDSAKRCTEAADKIDETMKEDEGAFKFWEAFTTYKKKLSQEVKAAQNPEVKNSTYYRKKASLDDICSHIPHKSIDERIQIISQWMSSEQKASQKLQQVQSLGVEKAQEALAQAQDIIRVLLNPGSVNDAPEITSKASKIRDNKPLGKLRRVSDLFKSILKLSASDCRKYLSQLESVLDEDGEQVVDRCLKWAMTRTTSVSSFLRGAREEYIVPDSVMEALFPLITVAEFVEVGKITLDLETERSQQFKNTRTSAAALPKIYGHLQTFLTLQSTELMLDKLSVTREYIEKLATDVADGAQTILPAKTGSDTERKYISPLTVSESLRKFSSGLQKLIDLTDAEARENQLIGHEELIFDLGQRKRLAAENKNMSLTQRRAVCIAQTDFGMFDDIRQELQKMILLDEQRANVKQQANYYTAYSATHGLNTMNVESFGSLFSMELDPFTGKPKFSAKVKFNEEMRQTMIRLVELGVGDGRELVGSTEASMKIVSGILESYDSSKKVTEQNFAEIIDKTAVHMEKARDFSNAVLSNVVRDSIRESFDREEAKFAYTTATESARGILSLGTASWNMLKKVIPVNLLLNLGIATVNAIDDVSAGYLPSFGKPTVAVSVDDKSERLKNMFIGESDSDFKILRGTHRDMSRCHFYDFDSEKRPSKSRSDTIMQRMKDDSDCATGRFVTNPKSKSAEDAVYGAEHVRDPFRIIAIPAMSRKASLMTAGSFIDQINGVGMKWSSYLQYICVDCTQLAVHLLREFKQTNDIRVDENFGSKMQEFKQNLENAPASLRLANPLRDKVREVPVVEFLEYDDIQYVVDWTIAYYDLHCYLEKHGFSQQDRRQIVQLGVRMGRKEFANHTGAVQSLFKTSMFRHSLVGLGFGLGLVGTGGSTSVMATLLTTLSSRYLIPTINSPTRHLMFAMTSRIVDSFSCVASVLSLQGSNSLSAFNPKPLIWVLSQQEVYLSGMTNFMGRIYEIGHDLMFMDAKNEKALQGQWVGWLLKMVGEGIKTFAGEGVYWIFERIQNILFHTFSLITPATAHLFFSDINANLSNAFTSSMLFMTSQFLVMGSVLGPISAAVASFGASTISMGGSLYVKYQQAKIRFVKFIRHTIAPKLASIIGQQSFNVLKRYDLLAEGLSVAILSALLFEGGLQFYYSFQSVEVDMGVPTWLTMPESISKTIETGITGKGTTVREKYGSLLGIVSAVNPISYMLTITTSTSVVDLLATFLMQQSQKLCTITSNTAKRKACSRILSKILELKSQFIMLDSIANIGRQLGIVAINSGDSLRDAAAFLDIVPNEKSSVWRASLSMFQNADSLGNSNQYGGSCGFMRSAQSFRFDEAATTKLDVFRGIFNQKTTLSNDGWTVNFNGSPVKFGTSLIDRLTMKANIRDLSDATIGGANAIGDASREMTTSFYNLMHEGKATERLPQSYMYEMVFGGQNNPEAYQFQLVLMQLIQKGPAGGLGKIQGQ
jgi:hypothetical protein